MTYLITATLPSFGGSESGRLSSGNFCLATEAKAIVAARMSPCNLDGLHYLPDLGSQPQLKGSLVQTHCLSLLWLLFVLSNLEYLEGLSIFPSAVPEVRD